MLTVHLRTRIRKQFQCGCARPRERQNDNDSESKGAEEGKGLRDNLVHELIAFFPLLQFYSCSSYLFIYSFSSV